MLYMNSGRVIAGTSMRGPEASASDSYSGFSVCNYTNDAEVHYTAHLCELQDYFTPDIDCIVMPRQTHTANVQVIRNHEEAISGLPDIDAIVTDVPGILIGINTADCVPVVIVDEAAGVIGAAHAGWRGAVAGIIRRTVEAMRSIGAEPERCRAYIAPAICTDCFEVGEEVAARFPERYLDRTLGVKPHVDLKGYVAGELEASGLPPAQISIDQDCTRCNPMRYFSARALGIASGRNFTFVGLNSR